MSTSLHPTPYTLPLANGSFVQKENFLLIRPPGCLVSTESTVEIAVGIHRNGQDVYQIRSNGIAAH